MGKKIYLSPSSQPDNPYAYGNTNEQEQCRKIASACATALQRCGFSVKNGNTGTMYTRTAESNSWGADLHVPIHTNAANGRTSGTRCFAYSTRGDGYRAAKAIFDVLAPITPGQSESITANKDLYEIRNTKAPCAYVECEFHDVPATSKWIVENTTVIGEAIAKGICNYYGVAYVEAKKAEEATTGTLYLVQAGAFRSKKNAEALVRQLKAAGFSAIIKSR